MVSYGEWSRHSNLPWIGVLNDCNFAPPTAEGHRRRHSHGSIRSIESGFRTAALVAGNREPHLIDQKRLQEACDCRLRSQHEAVWRSAVGAREKLLHQAPRTAVPWLFDVVIIGSGYGGSICAARLAAAKRPDVRIAVLERGREWIPGTYGDTLRQNSKESRFKLLGPNRDSIDNPVGLMNVMRNDEVDVLSGNGLGGSSLINANVAIRPDQECFQLGDWPAALSDRTVLEPYFDLAAWELGVQTEATDASPKAKAQRQAAEALVACGARLESAALAITRGKGCSVDDAIVNRQGLIQRACIDCGDCNTGCNPMLTIAALSERIAAAIIDSAENQDLFV